jgi:uncharacterized protein
MSIADEIEKLNGLRQSGAITEQEYQKAKEALLGKVQPAGEQVKRALDDVFTSTNQWAMFLHLSQFCGYVVPLAGLVLPIVLWQIKKSESTVIDRHGTVVVNWIITELILALAFLPLCFFCIGIPLEIALGVVGVVFPIIGAVRANCGEVWRYPLSIRFFKPGC